MPITPASVLRAAVGIVLRLDQLGFGQVQARLRFEHVGPGALAFFEQALVDFHLLQVHVALHLRQLDLVLGEQASA
jgi:hypothetical protein